MNKVYVTNFSGYPYDAANKFGELIFMTSGFIDLKNLDEHKNKITEFISKSNPEDYLILSGNNLIAGYAVHLWIEKVGFVNILHWDNISKSYVHYVLA